MLQVLAPPQLMGDASQSQLQMGMYLSMPTLATPQNQLSLGQLQPTPQAPLTAQAFAQLQMQQALAQQSLLARQGGSKSSLLQMQRQVEPSPQPSAAHPLQEQTQLQRQLQEQVVAQVWAQQQVQQQ